MKPKNLRELCDNPQLYEDEVTGYIFNGLWIKMVKELPLTWSVMNHKLNEWVNNPGSGIPNDNREKSSARGNAVKELARTDVAMTLKVFMKGIQIINPHSVHFAVGLELNPKLVRWFTLRWRVRDIVVEDVPNVEHNKALEEKHRAALEDARQQLALKLGITADRINIHID